MTNRIKSLTIKDFVPSTIPLDVVQVDVLYKNEIDPTIYLLKSITPSDNILPGQEQNDWNSPGSTDYFGADKGAYKVSSENISHALSSSQSLRVWDNVPKKAKSQELTGSRMISVLFGGINMVEKLLLKHLVVLLLLANRVQKTVVT